jgi:hypothetical protein
VQVKGEIRTGEYAGEDASHYECAYVAALLMVGEVAYQARVSASEAKELREEFAERMNQHMQNTAKIIGAAVHIVSRQQPQISLQSGHNQVANPSEQ